ncbi:hypothetical protein K491DRAFT_685445 [Lophiostoma macrostomum CBS 122681]|uniref:Uncharacterized protein n=1 Tax=Lophiostoma macrostomum CBS 122681 TaxID=1314788 RepID=A0A6A6SKK4_9PLEO|nr:hypothetical protein K491DRAFT_685445 [Lophiostoma macrostomum CBS 122681]
MSPPPPPSTPHPVQTQTHFPTPTSTQTSTPAVPHQSPTIMASTTNNANYATTSTSTFASSQGLGSTIDSLALTSTPPPIIQSADFNHITRQLEAVEKWKAGYIGGPWC